MPSGRRYTAAAFLFFAMISIFLASCAGINEEAANNERPKETRAIIEETYRIGVEDRKGRTGHRA